MTTRSEAVSFAMSQIMRSSDWQEVADALLNDGRFDDILPNNEAVLGIVRAAESKLGNKIPNSYSN